MRSVLFSKECPAVPVEVSAPEFHMDETEVERVIDSKIVGTTQYYLVKFKDLDEAFHMWLPITLMRCPKLISAYHQRAKMAQLPPPLPPLPPPLPPLPPPLPPLPPTQGFRPPRPRPQKVTGYVPYQT